MSLFKIGNATLRLQSMIARRYRRDKRGRSLTHNMKNGTLRVSSRLIEAIKDGRPFPVLLSRIEKSGTDQTTVIATVVAGSIGERQMLEHTNAFLNHFLSVHERIFPAGRIYAVDLNDIDGVDAKMQQSFRRVHDGDAIIYVGRDTSAREQALALLGLRAPDQEWDKSRRIA